MVEAVMAVADVVVGAAFVGWFVTIFSTDSSSCSSSVSCKFLTFSSSLSSPGVGHPHHRIVSIVIIVNLPMLSMLHDGFYLLLCASI